MVCDGVPASFETSIFVDAARQNAQAARSERANRFHGEDDGKDDGSDTIRIDVLFAPDAGAQTARSHFHETDDVGAPSSST